MRDNPASKMRLTPRHQIKPHSYNMGERTITWKGKRRATAERCHQRGFTVNRKQWGYNGCYANVDYFITRSLSEAEVNLIAEWQAEVEAEQKAEQERRQARYAEIDKLNAGSDALTIEQARIKFQRWFPALTRYQLLELKLTPRADAPRQYANSKSHYFDILDCEHDATLQALTFDEQKTISEKRKQLGIGRGSHRLQGLIKELINN